MQSQQGYVLAFSLMLMLFASLVVISSTQRTGTEQRIAASEVPRASLEAAAEAGIHRFSQAVRQLGEQGAGFTNKSDYCAAIFDAVVDVQKRSDFLGNPPNSFDVELHDSDPQIYWEISYDMDTCENEGIVLTSRAFAGPSWEEARSRLEMTAVIDFESRGNGLPPELRQALGRFADYTLAVGGAFTANGTRDYQGLIGVGGRWELNGNPKINGNTHHEEEIEALADWAIMPSPKDGWPDYWTGYIASVNQRTDVIRTCDLSTITTQNRGDHRYVYCDSNFSNQGQRGTLHQDLNGMILVAEGNFDGRIGSDLDISIITGGNLSLQGAGSNVLSGGVLWAAGASTLSGGPHLDLGVVINGSLTINGAGGNFGGRSLGGRLQPETRIQFNY